MAYDGWNLLGGWRLLGAVLVGLLGGDMDFKIVDGFVMTLETGFTFVLVNVNGLGGGGGRWGGGAERISCSAVNRNVWGVLGWVRDFEPTAVA